MSKTKHRSPRRKRMQRESRLHAAKHWIPTYNGGNIIKGYRKWFGVDLVCAIKELKILGVMLDEQYVVQALNSQEQEIAKKQKKHVLDDLPFDSDENFYFIAGYTSGGFPYGITWEEAELDNLIQEL